MAEIRKKNVDCMPLCWLHFSLYFMFVSIGSHIIGLYIDHFVELLSVHCYLSQSCSIVSIILAIAKERNNAQKWNTSLFLIV